MIEHLMTSWPVTIGPDDSVQRAAQLMDEFNVGALPVCTDNRVLGIVTDRDITVRATAVGLNPHLTQVHAVMSSPARSCCLGKDVSEVLNLMIKQQIRRVPVLDGNKKLVGIVSLGDLAERSASSAIGVLCAVSTPAQPDRDDTPSPSWLQEKGPTAGAGKARLFP